MKKTMTMISLFLSATCISSSACFPVAADSNITTTEVNCDFVTQEFMSSAGVIIPAGATAITININNCHGYVAGEFQLNIVGAELLTNPNEEIIIEEGSASRALYDFIKTPILRHIQMPNLISMSSL